jgi:predicted enzyme related to lactoylglutathione lyase
VQGQISRDYRRHWTPVHLDFTVEDIEAAVKRAVDAGGNLDGEIQRGPKGAMANMSDPSGNGVDLVCPVKK